MRNKALVYPFDQQFLPLIETKSFPEDFEIAFCISPKGWGFTGRDIGYTAYAEDQGLLITDDFDAALSEVDVVIFCSYQKHLDREKSILPRISHSIAQRKTIYCCLSLSPSERNQFISESRKRNVDFLYFGNDLLDIPLPFDQVNILGNSLYY